MQGKFFNSDGHIYPLSIQQKQFWYAYITNPRVPLWHLYDTIRLVGTINITAMKNAVNKLMNGNMLLKSNVVVRNKALVQYVPASRCVEDSFIESDYSSFPESEREGKARSRISEFITEYMDLRNGQLFKVLLLKMGKDDHILSLTVHHIICDSGALSLIWDELSHFYNHLLQDHKTPNTTNRSQYYEYVNSQKQKYTQTMLRKQEHYWRKQFLEEPATLNLPTDYPMLNQPIYHCSHQHFVVSAELTKSLEFYAMGNKTPPFSIFVSALYILLYLYTNQSDIIVGTTFSGRNRDFSGSDSIGLITNITALRIQVSKHWTIRELIEKVNETLRFGHKNQDYPVLSLLNKSRSKKPSDSTPLFQVAIYNLDQNKKKMLGTKSCIPSDFHNLKQRKWSRVETDTTPVELTFTICDDDEGKTHVFIYYWTMLYKKETIHRMGEHYQYILQLIIDNDSDKILNLGF